METNQENGIKKKMEILSIEGFPTTILVSNDDDKNLGNESFYDILEELKLNKGI